jgi:hypothetical protein
LNPGAHAIVWVGSEATVAQMFLVLPRLTDSIFRTAHSKPLTSACFVQDGYYPRWDSWERLVEPLASTVPIMSCIGNHEIAECEQSVSYNMRYPQPFRQSGSTSNQFWSRDVGLVHLVTGEHISPS